NEGLTAERCEACGGVWQVQEGRHGTRRGAVADLENISSVIEQNHEGTNRDFSVTTTAAKLDRDNASARVSHGKQPFTCRDSQVTCDCVSGQVKQECPR